MRSGPSDRLDVWLFRLAEIVGAEASTIITDTLQMAAESIDSLVDLMESLVAAVNEGLIDASSCRGVYLRRVCFGFHQLHFESVSFLWQDLCNQLSCHRGCGEVDLCQESYSADKLQAALPSSPPRQEISSQNLCRRWGVAETSYEEGELLIRQQLENASSASAAYFLRFVNSLKHKEKNAAESLQVFFDHVMAKWNGPSKSSLQFSSILLAFALESSGDFAASQAASDEATKVAHLVKDASNISSAVARSHPEIAGRLVQEEMLKLSLERAIRGHVQSMIVGSNLTLALCVLQRKRDPDETWKYIIDATADISAENIPLRDRPTRLVPLYREISKGQAWQTCFEGGLWDNLGESSLSSLSSIVALSYHREWPLLRKRNAYDNVIRQSLRGSSAMVPGLLVVRQSLRCTNQLAKTTKWASLVNGSDCMGRQRNKIDLANANLLAGVLTERNVKSSASIISLSAGQVNVENGVRRLQRMFLLGRWIHIRDCATELLKKELDISCRARLLNCLGNLETEASETYSRPSVSYALEACSECDGYFLANLQCAAVLFLSRIFLRMSKVDRAISLIKSSLPELLSRGHVRDQAEARLIQAKCHIHLAEQSSSTSTRWRDGHYHAALRHLKNSDDLCQLCKDDLLGLEGLYLQARVSYSLRRTDLCETASRRFFALLGPTISYQV